MKKTLFILITISALLTSCYNKSTGFKHDIKLSEGKIINFEPLTRNSYIYLLKDYILVFDLYSNTEGIHILDRQTLKYIDVTGKIGNGPNEIGRYGNISIIPNSNKFHIADFGKFITWKFDIDKMLNSKDYAPEKGVEWSYVGEKMDAFQFFIKDDTLYYMALKDHFFTKFITRDSVKYIGTEKKNLYNSSDNQMAYKTFSTMHPNLEWYAVGFKFCDKLAILDSNFNIKNAYQGNKQKAFTGNQFKDFVYYSVLKSDSSNIYAAFVNDITLQEDKEFGNHQFSFPKIIRVFSWNGEPDLEIYLNGPISSFVYDKLYNRLILYYINQENPLRYYELKI